MPSSSASTPEGSGNFWWRNSFQRAGKGGWGKAEEQPHALQKTCYPPSSSSATVARDCLISSAKPRLQVIASAVFGTDGMQVYSRSQRLTENELSDFSRLWHDGLSSSAPLMLPAFNCCHAVGWSNEPSLGSIETAAWQRISRLRSRAPKPGFTSPPCSSSSGDWLDRNAILQRKLQPMRLRFRH
jgi:hypothetical protein